MKSFVALARVSSREQEREGFSLAVQEDALKRYAASVGGEIVRLFRIAETASKSDERTAFRELVAYAKKHACELDGLLFYKVDRAARNLFDYVELERLESEYGLPFISVSQPTESNPAGRMMRRTLANMASFYTEQQSVDVREGHARRVQEGWFVSKAPYGYRNMRENGRSTIIVDKRESAIVRKIFQLFAYEPLTLDGVVQRLRDEHVVFRESTPQFHRSTVHELLRNRCFIGEVQYNGQWYPGKHEAIIERNTWDRVQALLGGHVYHSHELTYAGEFMTCGHCGRVVTGERIPKKTKSGVKHYVYYRCSGYTKPDHPRIRITESAMDQHLLAIFDAMRVEDPEVREWFKTVLAAQTKDTQADTTAQRAELQRQHVLLAAQQDRLLNMRLAEDIDQATFASKQTEFRDRIASIKLQLDVLDRSQDENADLAVKVFELSQTLRQQWFTADYAAKRRVLEIVCLNCELQAEKPVFSLRKPFDALADGLLLKNNRCGRI